MVFSGGVLLNNWVVSRCVLFGVVVMFRFLWLIVSYRFGCVGCLLSSGRLFGVVVWKLV